MTYSLGLRIVVGRVPLLGPLGVVRDLPGRLAELLAGRLRHCEGCCRGEFG
jgi:hypothetical protein